MGAANERHPRTGSVTFQPTWTQPCPDELLSSWLARVAVRGGCDPLNVTATIWPGWRVWSTDVDRGLSQSRCMTLAAWMRCDEALVHATTLLQYSERIHGAGARDHASIPWIISMGCRNRQRFAGVPCCPQCLQEDVQPYFRRLWRLAFVVGCEKHRVRLIDRCPACECIIAPHLCTSHVGNIGLCFACHSRLADSVCVNVQERALTLQRLAMNVLRSGEGLWQGRAVPAASWFSAMRRMATPQRCPLSPADQAEMVIRPTDLPLEMESPVEREARLSILAELLESNSTGELSATRRKLIQYKARAPAQTVTTGSVDEHKVRVQWARWLRRNRMW